MSKLSFVFLIVSLYLWFSDVKASTWTYDRENTRVILNARLTGANQDSVGDRGPAQCENVCVEDDNCVAFSRTDNDCLLHDSRFGFGKAQLVESPNNYYELPINSKTKKTNENKKDGGKMRQYLSDFQKREKSGSNQDGIASYLSRFRAPNFGYVAPLANPKSKTELMVKKTNVPNAEKCASYCLKDFGVIDYKTGIKCISFNYNSGSKECHLLSFSLDNDHKISGWGGGFQYYERLILDGCWISQSACKHEEKDGNKQHVGNFLEANVQWQHNCVEKAKEWHEDRCYNSLDVVTIAYFSNDGQGVYKDWNSWDMTTGCVIQMPVACKQNDPRFQIQGKKFRDSLGEEYARAGTSAGLCFERAAEYFKYMCAPGALAAGNDDTKKIKLEFPSTGKVYEYPATLCECDETGIKIDTDFSGLKFCQRKNSNIPCYRKIQQDFYTFKDILCDDTEYGCNNYTQTLANNHAKSGCYLYTPDGQQTFCKGEQGNIKFTNGLMELDCVGGEAAKKCSWTKEQCFSRVNQTVRTLCGAEEDDADKDVFVQYNVWHRLSGNTQTKPRYINTYEETLIRGIRADKGGSYINLDPHQVSIEFFGLRSGRHQIFCVKSNARFRGISIWMKVQKQSKLRLTLYKGEGITNVQKLTDTEIDQPITLIDPHDINLPKKQSGAFVHFAFKPEFQVNLEVGQAYTWEITMVGGEISNDVQLGFDRGSPARKYPCGRADFTWNYLFVTWFESGDRNPGKFLGQLDGLDTNRPWFEPVFITACAVWLIFVIFLCCLTIRRKRQEKKERDEDREFQRQLKEKKFNSMNNNDLQQSLNSKDFNDYNKTADMNLHSNNFNEQKQDIGDDHDYKETQDKNYYE